MLNQPMDCGDDSGKVRPEESDEQGDTPPSPTRRAPLFEVESMSFNIKMQVEESVGAEAEG